MTDKELVPPQMEGEELDIFQTMDILMDGFQFSMPFQKVQYFRTNRKVIKNEDGSTKKITKGIKKGVFLAFVDPQVEEKVCIGYSMCHPRDRFDYQKGHRFNGLGLWYAVRKAEKYRDSTAWRISQTSAEKQLPREIVKIPHSMLDDFVGFIKRCKLYYKDKELPAWAINFAQLNRLVEGTTEPPQLPDNIKI